MNLSNHFRAYANFSNNIPGQRFHSLDKLHDKKTLFVLSLLSCNLFDFLYCKTSSDQPLKKKDDLSFFSYDLKQITLLTRSETQWSKEITLMDNPFSPKKIIQNNMFPQAEVEKEEAGTRAPPRHPHTC